MTPFAVKSKDITQEDYAQFRIMRELVERLPDKIIEPELSCHHVCHALGRAFNVQVADGYFGYTHNHSWLVLRKNRVGEQVIADMYPVASAASFLVFAQRLTPWASLYKPNKDVLPHVRVHDRKFEQNVMTIAGSFGLVGVRA
jgi:hypothetical protein